MPQLLNIHIVAEVFDIYKLMDLLTPLPLLLQSDHFTGNG